MFLKKPGSYSDALGVIVSLIGAIGLAAQPAFAANGIQAVSPMVQKAVDLGPVLPDQPMTVTVYLGLHNQAAFDQILDGIYDPESARYHQWMPDEEIAKYSPTAQELATVTNELQKHSLTVLETDPANEWVRAQGMASNVQAAFQTEIHMLRFQGKTVYAHVKEAQLTGSAGTLVSNVVGLDEHTVTPKVKWVTNPVTGKPLPPLVLSHVLASSGLSGVITDLCLQPPTTENYTTAGAALPVGVYYGNIYNPISLTGASLACGFTAAQLQSHYGLTSAYKQGLNGAGQTIVLLEGYGYPTIEADANEFSKLMGLPALTASNFEIVYPEGAPNPTLGALSGWDVEIALDVQWSHSIAPGAKIVVVVSKGQDNEDFQVCMNYIISKNLGTVVSDSWEEDLDILAGPAEQNSYTSILKKAAAKGISFQFSTGDGSDDGLGTPIGASEVPSNNPWATGVGGTAILNNPNGGAFREIGWGDTETLIAAGGVFDPPEVLGYDGGGGGESTYFAKPAWQKNLPGTGRQSPDISALADPFTGVPLIVTQQGTQYVYVVGGTSLASPIVTAFLAIATQKAGHPIGLASALLPTLPANALIDIVPVSSSTNLSGIVIDSNGPTYYSPTALFQPYVFSTTEFISADWPVVAGPLGEGVALAFGMDGSLTVTKGWDNVTGYGVPNGLTFINAAGK